MKKFGVTPHCINLDSLTLSFYRFQHEIKSLTYVLRDHCVSAISTWESPNERGSLNQAERLVGFELGTFRLKLQRLNPLGHSPQIYVYRFIVVWFQWWEILELQFSERIRSLVQSYNSETINYQINRKFYFR